MKGRDGGGVLRTPRRRRNGPERLRLSSVISTEQGSNINNHDRLLLRCQSRLRSLSASEQTCNGLIKHANFDLA